MQIFYDESGGTDPVNTLFLVAAVRIDGVAATRLIKSFRKASGVVGEVKGFRLSMPERRLFFGLLSRIDGLAAAVVCDRRDPVGGWAMGALPETQVYEHLLNGACCLLPPVSGPTTVAVDGGRYKRAIYGELLSRLPSAIGAHHEGRASVVFANSAASAGIQVADVVANTLFHALGTDEGVGEVRALLGKPIAEGRLSIAAASFDGMRPDWLP